jgi:hypothetical protein
LSDSEDEGTLNFLNIEAYSPDDAVFHPPKAQTFRKATMRTSYPVLTFDNTVRPARSV